MQPGTPQTLLTFTNHTETNFNVFLLVNNADAGNRVNDGTLELSSSGSASMASVTATGPGHEDEYLKLSVTGAALGETFTLTGLNDSAIGGITFQQTPEPASAALILLGAAGLAALLRFRKRAA